MLSAYFKIVLHPDWRYIVIVGILSVFSKEKKSKQTVILLFVYHLKVKILKASKDIT